MCLCWDPSIAHLCELHAGRGWLQETQQQQLWDQPWNWLEWGRNEVWKSSLVEPFAKHLSLDCTLLDRPLAQYGMLIYRRHGKTSGFSTRERFNSKVKNGSSEIFIGVSLLRISPRIEHLPFGVLNTFLKTSSSFVNLCQWHKISRNNSTRRHWVSPQDIGIMPSSHRSLLLPSHVCQQAGSVHPSSSGSPECFLFIPLWKQKMHKACQIPARGTMGEDLTETNGLQNCVKVIIVSLKYKLILHSAPLREAAGNKYVCYHQQHFLRW